MLSQETIKQIATEEAHHVSDSGSVNAGQHNAAVVERAIRRALVEVLLPYAIYLCDSRNLSFKNDGYKAAVDQMKTNFGASIERLQAGEEMESFAYTQESIIQPAPELNPFSFKIKNPNP